MQFFKFLIWFRFFPSPLRAFLIPKFMNWPTCQMFFFVNVLLMFLLLFGPDQNLMGGHFLPHWIPYCTLQVTHPPFPLLLTEKDCTVSNCTNIHDADRKQAIRGYWWLNTRHRERWKKPSFSLYCTSVWDSSCITVLSTRRFTASNINRLNEHDFINIFSFFENSRNVKYVCTFSDVVSLGGN